MLSFIHLRNSRQVKRNKMSPQSHCSEIVIAIMLGYSLFASRSFSLCPRRRCVHMCFVIYYKLNMYITCNRSITACNTIYKDNSQNVIII